MTSDHVTRARLLGAVSLIVLATPAGAQVLVGDGSVACGTDYTIAAGDTLSLVAERAYGDPLLYPFILDANWEALRGDAERVNVGMALEIPCVDVSGRILSAEEAAEAAASIEAVVAATGPLTPGQLDTLFGPVALFPDPVLSQLLVAVTFPLDVVKAGRFVAETADRPAKERAAQAEAQPWDPSVRGLAAAFPELVNRMDEHIDWTEQAGEAVLAETDAVLAAIQRLRAKAQENGYLVDNEAQQIVEEAGVISIAPASPEVVYVPTYSSEVVYTTPVTTAPVYYYDDYDSDWGEALVAGGIMLGGAIILDEIFDDDDWDGWDDWDDDVDIDWDGGDITIDRDEINIGGGDRINVGDGQIGDGERGDRVELGDGQLGSGERPLGDGERGSLGDRQIGDGQRADGSPRSIGELDRPAVAALGGAAGAAAGARRAGAGGSVSSPATREAARQKIEARQSFGGSVATLPASPRAGGARAAGAYRGGGGINFSNAARPSVSAGPSLGSRQMQASRPTAQRSPAMSRSPSRSNAFAGSSGGRGASAAASRGRMSAGGGRAGGGRGRR
jgi:hypothetical protein